MVKRPQHWAQITAQSGVNLDRPAAVILHTIINNPKGSCRVQDLATQLGIEAPSVTRKTQELELAGYLRRQRDTHDRRAVGLRVTARGRLAGRKLWSAQREGIRHALSAWPASDRKKFTELFERFNQDVADYYKNQ